jgi:hypothetical protein
MSEYDDFMSYVYGPLGSEYCMYFYYLSIFGFVLFIFTMISSLVVGIAQKKGSSYFLQMMVISLGYGIFYFQNRLLYSMCIRGNSTRERLISKEQGATIPY